MVQGYTTIEQSRKLTEVLPLESADMKWYFWKSEIDAPKLPTFGYSKTAAENYKDTEAIYLPCWSLTALLGVLPNDCGIDKKNGKYIASYLVSDECGTYTSDNPIDSCVSMIEYLHKLNLL